MTPWFRYRAARPDGATVRGRMEAVSPGEAAALLSTRGLYPVAVEPVRHGETVGRRPPARERAIVLRGLASLVTAAVPLQRALEATAALTGGRLRAALERIGRRVAEGQSLAAALAGEPVCFSAVTVGLVRAGERGLGLDRALAQAALQLEREAELRARIRAALAYPALVALVGVASVGLILFGIVPRFTSLVAEAGAALPPAAQVLFALSFAVRQHAAVILLGLVVAGAVGLYLVHKGRGLWHRELLRLPVFGTIRHAFATARVSRILAALLESGVSALAALDVARDAVGDRAIADRLAAARDRVAEGAGLAAALAATRALTPAALQLAALGEAAGRLPVLLDKAAELEEQAAERRLRALVTLLEPALILCLAALVAFVAAALLQALYSVRPL